MAHARGDVRVEACAAPQGDGRVEGSAAARDVGRVEALRVANSELHSTARVMGSGKALFIALLMVLSSVTMLATAAREESPNFSGPVAADRFEVGWADGTYRDYDNDEIDIRIYYPASSAGEEVAVDCAWAPYPWLVFHGDNGEDFDGYEWVGQGLAKAGYIAIVVGEERSANQPWPAIMDHYEMISMMGNMNYSGANGIQGCIDMDHWGVAGHGTGAGLAAVVNANWGRFLGSNSQPPRALIGLGLDTDQSGNTLDAYDQAAPNHALFLTGTVDEVAPANEHAEPFLDYWKGGWQLLEVVGANHVQYEDDQSFLDNLFDGDATMTAEEQQAHAISKILPYLDLTLKGDEDEWYRATSRESDPVFPSDADSYLSENLAANQFYLMTPEENVVIAPSGRIAHSMFYDPIAERTVMVGGTGNGENLDDYWTLDLNGSGEWELQPDAPNSVGTGAFGFDGEASGLLYGSTRDGSPTLWSWNGWSGTWTAYPDGVRPPANNSNSMVWDGFEEAFLSYGGSDDNSEGVNETWAFDPTVGVWQEIQTAGGPRGVIGAAMFFSESWNRSFLFGGVDLDYDISNETWMFNSQTNTWSKLALQGEYPEERAYMATAMDYENEIGYIYDSDWGSGAGELWAFDMVDLTWQKLSSFGAPERMDAGEMAYDSVANKLILFGGSSWSQCPSGCDETWLYDFESGSWELYASSSAVTVSDTIYLQAVVTERDLSPAPWNLTVQCRILSSDGWTTGGWDVSNSTAACDLSPFALSPGYHSATLRVIHDGQQASSMFPFERANAPPQPNQNMPSFVLTESGELSINASEIASDPDGHEVRFVTNTLTFTAKGEDDLTPSLQWDVMEDWRLLTMEDVSNWNGRWDDSTFEVCGNIRDEGSQGNPPIQVPFCFDVVNSWQDDPFIVTEHPSFTIEEDSGLSEFDLTPYGYDEEGDPATVRSNNATAEQVTRLGLSTNGPTVSIEPALHWNGQEAVDVCIRHRLNGTECSWMTVTVIVTPVADPPMFNFTEIQMTEDEVYSAPLDEMIWDPDGDELNITLEDGEQNLTVELWHEQLRITPTSQWFGRAVNWAIVVTDGETEIRQPIRIVVAGVDDPTLVSWQQPADIDDNMTKLRFDITDPDTSGPWTIEYNWDDGNWSEISPSCSEQSTSFYECQADLLTNSLAYGDHELNLRVNDGESISDISTYWLSNPDPNRAGASSGGPGTGVSGLVFVLVGLGFVLVAGGVLVYLMRKETEYVD